MTLTPEQLKECATLKQLFKEKSEITQRAFAKKYDLGSPANFGQYLQGRRALNLRIATTIARALEIEVSSFSPRLARQIASYNLGPNAPAHVNNGMAIPLVSFDQVSQVSDGEKLQEMLGNASVDEHLLVDATLPENCFAMCIEDHSMQPEFLKGDFIIVDPMLRPLPGDFVVANIANSVSCMIRKYRQIGFDDHGNESFELMPLNNDFASAYSDKQTCRIVGVVIEHRRKYRNK